MFIRTQHFSDPEISIEMTILPEWDGPVNRLLESCRDIKWKPHDIDSIDKKELDSINRMLASESRDDRMFAYDLIVSKYKYQK